MPGSRYAKELFSQEWNVKPRRGRQRKRWGKVVEDIFTSLDINKINVHLCLLIYWSICLNEITNNFQMAIQTSTVKCTPTILQNC